MAESGLGLSKGATFNGRYKVSGLISLGGMGAVYEVVHAVTGRPFALKVLLPHVISGADFEGRFRLEATATAKVRSEHVVGVLDAGLDESTGLPFLVTELLKGEDLAALVRRRGPLRGSEVVLLFDQLRYALDKTHGAGIVHRDLKPENLFLTERDDGSPCLKVLDFGIAKLVDSSTFPRTTCGYGTPLYMPPEQIRGEGTIGPAADLYSLGHIAFALMVGQAYWEPEARESRGGYAFFKCVLDGAQDQPSVRAARLGVTLPLGFDGWFARSTERDPSARFETASELVEELAAALCLSLPGEKDGARPERSLGPSPAALGTRAPDASQDDRGGLSRASTGALPVHPRSAGRRGKERLLVLPILLLVAVVGLVLSTRNEPRPFVGPRPSARPVGEDVQAMRMPREELGNRRPFEHPTSAPELAPIGPPEEPAPGGRPASPAASLGSASAGDEVAKATDPGLPRKRLPQAASAARLPAASSDPTDIR